MQIAQSLYFLNPKFQASSHLLWLHSPVCVGPGQKTRRPVFSERGSCGFQTTSVSNGVYIYQCLKLKRAKNKKENYSDKLHTTLYTCLAQQKFNTDKDKIMFEVMIYRYKISA